MRRIVVTLILGFLVSMLVPAASGAALPSAERIAYSDTYGGSGIYTIDPDGSDRMHVVSDTSLYRPKWLPDGSGISFLQDTGAHRMHDRLEAVDVNGSNRRVLIGRHQLPSGYRSIASYAWSPDGTQLVLSLYKGRDFREMLFVANADGSSLVKIAADAGSPDWSSLDRIVAVRNGRLITLDPDGGNVVRLANGISYDPDWSPDGTRIAYMCRRLTHADVCVVNADGTGRVDLTGSHAVDWSPSWSPSGTQIIWATSKGISGFGDLRVMGDDGTGQIRVTDTRKVDEYEPDWIAFA
jgi:Tol biopolymer transport system component